MNSPIIELENVPSTVGQSESLVSVVIPAFQCAEYISQAIQSVLSQTYPEFEIIIINDGSPDTPELEAVLTPYFPKIRYFKQSTTGPAGARNTGIREARGKYVAFLDSDDYWSPEHLARQLAFFRRDSTLDVTYCDYMLIKNERPFARAFDMQSQSQTVSFEALLVEDCAIGMSTAVCRRESILKAGLFDEELLRCEDFEMWLRMSLLGARMAYNADVQVFHRINEAGLSADKWSMKKDRIRVYQKIASTFSISERQRGIVRELITRTEADCHVDELKQALEKRDYASALAAARHASETSKNWKVRASMWGLRIMPDLFRRFHLVRSYFQRTSKKPVKIANGFGQPSQSETEDERGHAMAGNSRS
jgi:glycosyltransferase involved in cell wall biosynthesis